MNFLMQILMWVMYIIALYFTIFWLISFLVSRKKISEENRRKIKIDYFPNVSIVIPAYDEETNIARSMKSVLSLNYPKEKIQLIVVNDGSKDNTKEVVLGVISENKGRDILFIDQKNMGKAASLNKALKYAYGRFFACLDADSYVEKDTLRKMISYFQECGEEPALLTPTLKVDNPKNALQKFQRVEYLTAMFIIRMMGYLDCIYIAPGPFTIYRTEIVRKLGGFDEQNLTEDQEIAYRMQKHHYVLKQCPRAYVYTVAPKTLKMLYKQRNRWFKGTLLNVFKYKKLLLNKEYGDFGFFQMPYNLIAFLLGICSVFFFTYQLLKPLSKAVKDLFIIDFDIWPYLKKITITFNLLDLDIGTLFLICVLFLFVAILFYLGHRHDNEKIKSHGIIYLAPYFFLYYLFLSFVSVIVILEVLFGKRQRW